MCLPRNAILQLSTRTPTYPLKLSTSYTVDVGAIWQIHSKYTVNKHTAKISMSGIAIISMLHGYSRQYSASDFLGNSWASCYALVPQ